MAGGLLQCIKYAAHKIETLLTALLRHVWCQTGGPHRGVDSRQPTCSLLRVIGAFIAFWERFLPFRSRCSPSAVLPTNNNNNDCRGMGMSLLFGDLVGKI